MGDPVDLRVGARYEQVLVDDLTRTQLVQYAGASGDFNPLHTDEVFARHVAGRPAVMAHGMLTMGMTATFLGDVVGADGVESYGGRFLRPVWPGDTLRSALVVMAIGDSGSEVRVEVSLETTNQHGEAVFTGYATARVRRDPGLAGALR